MPEDSAPNGALPPTRWENSRAQRLEPNPSAMLICDGLLGMCSPAQGKCEIGFLSLPDSNDSELNKHKPEIVVISVENRRPETLFRLQWQRKVPPFSRLRLRLMNGFSPARFFLGGAGGRPGQDFRETVDIEHELTGTTPLAFRRGAFSPLLEVANGDFHTLLLTPQTYTAIEDGGGYDVKPLGHLAYMTAANLHCHPENGSVVLEMKDEISQVWVKLGEWSVRGRKIFVVVSNNCQDENGNKCEDVSFKAGRDADPKTDFHLYFDTILDPPKRYNIVCDQSPTMPDFLSLHPFEIQLALAESGLIRTRNDKSTWEKGLEIEPQSTNPTPCGDAGFGGSGSLEGGG